MEKIKLVIWDLDETFWKGTLSEEGIEPVKENIELIKTLVDRGIMNSIASKNNFDEAKKKLEELGIWDYFIFPKIDWLPKGQLVKNIIEEVQLRAPNVLFLDDNHLNLEEVEFYNPGINVKSPEFIPNMLEHPALKGKLDINHSRLAQYKVLEKKAKTSKLFSDNKEFLKFSEIKLKFSNIEDSDINRIHELIERTNQLNFTKKRDTINELKNLLSREDIKAEKIEVWDKFGDYGIVGFYVLDKKENNLIHFVFSCRTMNIGVEQYVFQKLNYPKLVIQGDVSSKLENKFIVDWIREVKNHNINKKDIVKNKTLKILLKGGCDLGQMIHYLQYKNIEIITEFNDVNSLNIPLHKEHTVFCRNAFYKDFYKKNIDLLEYIPFIDETFYQTKIYDDGYDVVIYSLLMDYTQQVYKAKCNEEVEISYGGYNHNLIDNEDYFLQNVPYITKPFLKRFKEDYISLGQISPSAFKKNLEFILSKIKVPIILINGVEINSTISSEFNADKRHKEMNAILDEIIDKYDNVYLLDMRKIIKSDKMLEDNIRHYKREIYSYMAQELVEIIELITNIKAKENKIKSSIGKFKHYLKKEIKDKILKR